MAGLLDDLVSWCMSLNIVPLDVGRSSCMCHMLWDACPVLRCRGKAGTNVSVVFVRVIINFILLPLRLGPLCGIFPDLWGVPHYANRSMTRMLIQKEQRDA